MRECSRCCWPLGSVCVRSNLAHRCKSHSVGHGDSSTIAKHNCTPNATPPPVQPSPGGSNNDREPMHPVVLSLQRMPVTAAVASPAVSLHARLRHHREYLQRLILAMAGRNLDMAPRRLPLHLRG